MESTKNRDPSGSHAETSLASEIGGLASLIITRAGVRLHLANRESLHAAFARAARLMDIVRLTPEGTVGIDLRQLDGETLRFVEFARAGELSSEVLRRWYDRMTREHEVPAHVREFLDYVFLGAMEQWDTETC